MSGRGGRCGKSRRALAAAKEAAARIKINRLLETAGWRFVEEDGKPANVCPEPQCKLKKGDLEVFGDDFEWTNRGFIHFLLLDEKGFPCVVLEAKSEEKNPLIGKDAYSTPSRTPIPRQAED